MNKRVLAIVLALALLAVAACGDDDDDDTAGGSEAFCEGYAELVAGDPEPDDIRAVAEEAPEEAREALERIADGFEEDGEDYFESEEFEENFETIGRIAADECADESFDVGASEYRFDGIPAEIATGTIAVSFENNGAEFHELVVMRRNDGVTQSFEEILAMGEEEAQELVTEKGGTFAAPGQTAPGLFQLDEPGDYAAACFLPVGSTPDNEDADGPPHFTQGMLTEFTVG